MRILLAGLLAVVPLPADAVSQVTDPGEFHIPSVQPLSGAQLQRLRALAGSDPSARKLARQIEAEALPLLAAEPHPLREIHYEGLVNTDPRRIATVEKLKEMADVARLMRYWQVSGDARAAEALKRFILAWSSTYVPTGNDVNDNKFHPLMVAYESLRDRFPAPERRAADDWVRRMGELHEEAVRTSEHFTNRYAKSVRVLATAGLILDRPEWVATAHEGVKRFVSHSLRADGSSLDLERRDALSYHNSALRPMIELAMLAGPDGADLYTCTSPEGGSLKRSVDFVLPYARGEKVHAEWVNTQVGLDRRRAAADLKHYRTGRHFEPHEALRLLEEASYFDPWLLPLVRQLAGAADERFPTWQTLVNEAARTGA